MSGLNMDKPIPFPSLFVMRPLLQLNLGGLSLDLTCDLRRDLAKVNGAAWGFDEGFFAFLLIPRGQGRGRFLGRNVLCNIGCNIAVWRMLA